MHRHIFHIRLAVRVSHCDRDIEIITAKNQLLQFIGATWGETSEGVINFGSSSCEAIALAIMERFDAHWVEVLEDGENGAEVFIANEAR